MIAKIENGDLVNWKPYVASTIWFSGCNTSCSYCHNKELLLPKYIAPVDRFLDMIPDIIEHVVLSGGEPTCSVQYEDTILELHRRRKKIHVYTNGLQYPQELLKSFFFTITLPESAFNSNIFSIWERNIQNILFYCNGKIRVPSLPRALDRISEIRNALEVIKDTKTQIEIFEVKE